MPIVRALAVLTIVAFSCYGVHQLAWTPLRCDVVKRRAQLASLEQLKQPGETMRTAADTRARIDALEKCLPSRPTDVDMYMTLALNYRLIGRLDSAAGAYAEALRYDNRPELYYNLGNVQFQMGRTDVAIDTLAKAVAFEASYANTINSTIRESVLARARTIRGE